MVEVYADYPIGYDRTDILPACTRYQRSAHGQRSWFTTFETVESEEKERVVTNRVAYLLYASLMPQRQAITMIIIHCSKLQQPHAATPTPLAHRSHSCTRALALGHDTSWGWYPSVEVTMTRSTYGGRLRRHQFESEPQLLHCRYRFSCEAVSEAPKHNSKIFRPAFGVALASYSPIRQPTAWLHDVIHETASPSKTTVP